jgi:hypothetical protein
MQDRSELRQCKRRYSNKGVAPGIRRPLSHVQGTRSRTHLKATRERYSVIIGFSGLGTCRPLFRLSICSWFYIAIRPEKYMSEGENDKERLSNWTRRVCKRNA